MNRRYRVGHLRSAAGDSTSSRPARSRFELTDSDLNTHVLAIGTTGAGKTSWLHQLLAEHWRNGRGCCVIEPGDLIDDFLAARAREAMETGDRRLLQKLHVVELSPFQLARYDLFRFHYPKPVHPELRETLYGSWQHTKVQSVAEIYQWKQGQSTNFEGMPNLQRNFINMFTSVTTLVNGRRLSAADADILIDLHHPDHDRVYQQLEPRLPRAIVADFDVLHAYRNVRDLRQETGSFLNRIRSTHGPLFKEMISTDGREPSLDLYGIIQRGDFLLVKTARTPFASEDQNLVLGSVFLHDIAETMFVTPRELRREFTLVVDEAHRFVRPGIGDFARTGRKYGLGLVLATTDLASLKRGEFDLATELLNVVNTCVAFRMTWPEDLKKIAEYLFAQNIDFTDLLHEVERRAGHEWIPVDEWSESAGRQSSHSTSSGSTVTAGTSQQEANGRGSSESRSSSWDGSGLPSGSGRSVAGSVSSTATRGRQESAAEQSGVSDTAGESYGVSISHKLVHLEKIIRENQKTGMLEQSVADQLARFAQQISGQPQRCAVVRVRERPAVQIEAVAVREPFRSPDARARAVEWIKRELYQVHDYYFTPSIDARGQQRRIDEFVRPGATDVARATAESFAGASPLL